MKKFMILVVGIFLVFGFAGCFNTPTGPTSPPATVYDPTATQTATTEESVIPTATATATATATVSAVATETWRIEIIADPNTTFELTYRKVEGANIIVLFSSTSCITDSTSGKWDSTEFSFDAIYRLSYVGKVTGGTPTSFIVKIYKNGTPCDDEVVYPGGTAAPDFGGSIN